MTTISATTILRSRNSSNPNKVLSTLLLRYPRCIHAELMTHRVFSRNSASSRAIPVKKLIQDVIDNPFVPKYWLANKPGMQGGEELNSLVVLPWYEVSDGNLEIIGHAMPKEEAWLYARDRAVEFAQAFSESGYHKQIINRLLEPFAHITVLVSSTEWENFIALRNHPDAEPHIRDLAIEVMKCLDDESTIQNLNPGEWHLPFITVDDWLDAYETTSSENQTVNKMIKKSMACCASTSYKTVDGFDMTLKKAMDIHDKLITADLLHSSPAEHVSFVDEYYGNDQWKQKQLHGNFVGFCQYRKMFPNENITKHWNS